MQRVRPYVSTLLQTAAAPSVFAYSQDASTLCPLVLNSDTFFSNRKKNKQINEVCFEHLRWNSKRVTSPVNRKSVGNKTTLEWPQFCVASTKAACLWSFPRAYAFNPSQRTSTCVHVLPVSKPCLITFVKALYLSKPNSHGLCHLWSANNKHYLPQIPRIK